MSFHGNTSAASIVAGLAMVLAGRADVRGQEAMSAEVVGPGVISTEAVEHNAAFSPDGRTMFFTRNDAPWGEGGRSTIYVTRRVSGEWAAPYPARFSGEHSDSDAFVSPDGRELFFVSTRPNPEGGGGRDIWVVDLDGESNATSEPRPVAGDVNTPADEYSPVLTASGKLYFASVRDSGLGQGDLYAADRHRNGFGVARNLGAAVNSPFGEWNLIVDSGETSMVFESSGRALNRSMPGDLYVSFREAGEWTAAAPVRSLNTPGSDLMPRISPDGETLYFSSATTLTSSHTDIFRADLATVLSEARQEARAVLVAVSRSDHHVAIIDPQTLQILRRIDTGAGPHEVAAVSGGRAIVPEYGGFPNPHDDPVDTHPGFAPVVDGNIVRLVDLAGQSPPEVTTLSGCARTHGVTSSSDGRLAWVSCEEEAAVLEIETSTGEVARRWDTRAVGSHRVAVTPDDRYLVVANVGAGSVTVIDRTGGSSTLLDTGAGSEGMAVAGDGTVWVLASGARTLSQIDPASAEILRSLPTGGQFPISVSLDEERGVAWVAAMGPRAVDVIDLESGERVDRVQFDTGPLRVLVVPESRHAYVSLPRENALAVIDRASRRVVGRVEGIMEIDGLAWTWLEPTEATTAPPSPGPTTSSDVPPTPGLSDGPGHQDDGSRSIVSVGAGELDVDPVPSCPTDPLPQQ